MGLASDMKNLSEELLASFKQRIKENEELVNDVQKTLDGFHKDHMEMTAVLNANAAALRKGLALGEKERMDNYNELMNGIHQAMAAIQKEVMDIQAATLNMVKEFSADRAQMAAELGKFFADNRAGRMEDEKTRLAEFDALMNSINADIKAINDQVANIFKNTNDMLVRFDKEHMEMSAELRAELGKNLADRVDYTRKLLKGFQKRLAEIHKENQQMAQKLRKDLANGEAERLHEYNDLMKAIHQAIKEIQKEVNDIQKATAGMLADLLDNRIQASVYWNKMQEDMAQIRKTGTVEPPKPVAKKAEKVEKKNEVKTEAPVEVVQIEEPAAVAPMTLEEKVLDYIGKHPMGVKISEMELPLGETRMKLGFTAKALLEQGKVQKVENVYFPLK